MIHTTHRETLIACDRCTEHDWLPPMKRNELNMWLVRNGWRSDGSVYFCKCCAHSQRRAA